MPRNSRSSSSSSKNYYYDLVESEEEDDEWLELGLGPAGNSRPSTSQAPTRVPELGLELGLGFGDDDDGSVRRSRRMLGGAGLCLAPPQAYFNHGHDDHHMLMGQHGSCLPSLPPSSSLLPLSWQHMDLAGLFNRVEGPRMGHHPSGSGPHVMRPCSGVWFSLRTSDSRNLGGEALPQIPKAYIRVKDENVTIFMVKTYLVRKLGLTSESEIDISCMGRKLSHLQTLKYVRDSVWLPAVIELLSGTASMETEQAREDELSDAPVPPWIK